jgi:hypothetical protein
MFANGSFVLRRGLRDHSEAYKENLFSAKIPAASMKA